MLLSFKSVIWIWQTILLRHKNCRAFGFPDSTQNTYQIIKKKAKLASAFSYTKKLLT